MSVRSVPLQIIRHLSASTAMDPLKKFQNRLSGFKIDQKRLLDILNHDDLMCFIKQWKSGISIKVLAQQIHSHKLQQKSSFSALENLLNVEDLNEGNIIKLLRHIRIKMNKNSFETGKHLPCSNRDDGKMVLRQNAVSPSLASVQDVKSVVCLDVDVDQVCWVHMDKQFNVIEWQLEQLDIPANSNFNQIYHKVSTASHQIPNADIYSIESKNIRENFPKMIYKTFVPMLLSRVAVQSIMLTFLKQRCSRQSIHTVDSGAMVEYFQLKVGGERVSSKLVVNKMVTGKECRVNIPHISKLESLHSFEQEKIFNCLLQGRFIYEYLPAQ